MGAKALPLTSVFLSGYFRSKAWPLELLNNCASSKYKPEVTGKGKAEVSGSDLSRIFQYTENKQRFLRYDRKEQLKVSKYLFFQQALADSANASTITSYNKKGRR
jgi:hypothetical protein